MKYVTLGKTGLKVSKIGLGGIPIQKNSAEEVKELLMYLMEQGVNYVDSARGYTVSEALLGEAMDTGDKAINKAMAIAYKYLCFQVFCIPVEDMDDPDAERPELQGESHKENRSGTHKSNTKKQEAPKEEPVQNNDTSASDSAPMTDQMYQTLLKEMERTGVSEKIILGRKQLKDKKRKSIKEFDISDFKYVMNIFEKTPDKPKEGTDHE